MVSGCATLLARRVAKGVHAWTPFYIWGRGKNVQKKFFTYREQIEKLKNEKNLLVPNENYAEQMLEKWGYYSLIGGYKKLFKHAASGKYRYGVTFEEIVALYQFDEELRTLFLKYILHVERHIKSLISYYFCEKYGERQQEYLKTLNYNLTKKNSSDINRMIYSIQQAISLPSRYTYITHHANKYGNIPLWVAMNVLTFGQVSKMYQYAPNNIQNKISKKFDGVTERELHQFITVVARCRNICAHGERLFSFRSKETIPDTALHKKLKIAWKKGQYAQGKQDLFAIVIALRYLISDNEFKGFKAVLKRLMNHVLKSCPHITKEQLYAEMGFPENWDSIARYKKV